MRVRGVDGLAIRGDVYWADLYVGPERFRQSLRTKDLSTAMERLAFFRAGLERVTPDEDVPAGDEQALEAITPTRGFEKVAEAYLDDLGIRSDRANSVRNATYQLGQILRVLPDLKRRHLKAEDLRTFARQRRNEGVSAATINHAVAIAQAITRFGVRERMHRDPVIDFGAMKAKAPRRLSRFLTEGQIAALLSHATDEGPRALAVFFLAANTGCRIGELRALKWSWVDFDTGYVRLPAERTKTNTERVFVLPEPCLRWLRGYRGTLEPHAGDDAPVLQMVPGKPWTDHIHKVVRRVFRAAGLDSRIGVHGLRHSSISRMAGANVPVHVAAKAHGCSPETALRVYTHARMAQLEDAALATGGIEPPKWSGEVI